MLDIKWLRENMEQAASALATRGYHLDIEALKSLDAERKTLQVKTETLQSERNQKSKIIGQAKAKGIDASILLVEMTSMGNALKEAEIDLQIVQEKLQTIYDLMPNIPHATTPVGKSESDNIEVRRWGIPKAFAFEPKDHVTLAKENIDFETAAKLTGARFAVLRGKIARLHRALGQFMLDLHTTQHGYQEVYVPYIVSGHCLYGTGQLPKFAEDQFSIQDEDWWLIPTAEVAVTNLVRENILNVNELPLQYVCHSPCFRKEAGSYGKDMRGMLRQHQFDKVELVQVVLPEHSYVALEKMVVHAEKVLQLLELPYRLMALCTGDIGNSVAKTYDLEVWLPGQDRYREISSCSNAESFQARRMQARFRHPKTQKTEFVHTLNGSGLAVGRTLIAVMENYQDESGRIHIPKALLPYMGGVTMIETTEGVSE
jgi:seryl-tRNA synthetase